jgi:glycosyltransferase involved in cell wall biosynthesis
VAVSLTIGETGGLRPRLAGKSVQMSESTLDTPVTVVVATYNRPKLLERALRSLRAQTRSDWQALVIGDACGPETGDRVAALGDRRIRYVNLPERNGEQSVPNSVGVALAETDHVAFLNQDDLWLPDHLELALGALAQTGAAMFWGQAAFFSYWGRPRDGVGFDGISPSDRTFADLYTRPNYLAEPMSAWVARRSELVRLGPFRQASDSGVYSIVEFCHRAARAGTSLICGDRISVLKDRVIWAGRDYDNPADYAEAWIGLIEAGQSDALRDRIDRDLWLFGRLGLCREGLEPPQPEDGPRLARIDRETGINLTELVQQATGKAGQLIVGTLRFRTGEELTTQPDLDRMIAHARASLA